MSLIVIAGNIVKASYPALHALHFTPQKSILEQQNELISSNLQQKSSNLNNDLEISETAAEDFDNHPQYRFAYGIKDLKTGDDKQQEEKRDGDIVQGQVRYVLYDKENKIIKLKFIYVYSIVFSH